jgi:hypothetical protein
MATTTVQKLNDAAAAIVKRDPARKKPETRQLHKLKAAGVQRLPGRRRIDDDFIERDHAGHGGMVPAAPACGRRQARRTCPEGWRTDPHEPGLG